MQNSKEINGMIHIQLKSLGGKESLDFHYYGGVHSKILFFHLAIEFVP